MRYLVTFSSIYRKGHLTEVTVVTLCNRAIIAEELITYPEIERLAAKMAGDRRDHSSFTITV